MKTNLSFSAPADVETDCLVVVALDRGEKDKPNVSLETADQNVKKAAAGVLASGETTGKPFETTLIHGPANLKAKRLLIIGGGKDKTFSAFDLRRVVGAAVRSLKPKGIRTFAVVVVPGAIAPEEAVKASVEGAFIGDFDPDVYKSDRKDQKIGSITFVASGDQAKLQQALEQGQIIGESQNFTRTLVN